MPITPLMPGVEHVLSAALGGYGVVDGGMRPLAVMSHVMQGFQRTMVDWAQERPAQTKKSAHFTIGRDGRIVQHVPITTPAWHAGRLDPGVSPTWRLLPPGQNPSAHTVGIEHEGFSAPAFNDSGQRIDDFVYSVQRPWPEPMIEATIRVHQWLFEELGLVASVDTVIGHHETAPHSRAQDPGPLWPRSRILAALFAEGPTPEDEETLSPALSAEDAYRAVTDAFFPAFDPDKTTLAPLPLDGEVRQYLLRIDPRR